jgi:hypothetical protein
MKLTRSISFVHLGTHVAKFLNWCGKLCGLVWLNFWTRVVSFVDWCGWISQTDFLVAVWDFVCHPSPLKPVWFSNWRDFCHFTNIVVLKSEIWTDPRLAFLICQTVFLTLETQISLCFSCIKLFWNLFSHKPSPPPPAIMMHYLLNSPKCDRSGLPFLLKIIFILSNQVSESLHFGSDFFIWFI